MATVDITDNQQLINRIVDKVKGGTPPDVAARSCGITIRTFKDWMRRGEDETDGPYADFYNRLSQADAQNEESLATKFREAAEADWKANEAYMGHMWPQRWGKNTKNTIQIGIVDEDAAVPVLEQLADPETRKALADLHSAISGYRLPEGKPETIEAEFREITDGDDSRSE